MATDGGELAILDWAMVGSLRETDREQLSQLLLSAQLLDPGGLCRAIEKLCIGALPDAATLRCVVDRLLVTARNPLGLSFSWVANLMDKAALECGARFSNDLLLFRKALLVLEGVVADMVGEGGLDCLLSSSAIRQLAREWPARAFLPPDSRRLGSRLSSLDLFRAGFLFPWVVATQWFERREMVGSYSAQAK